MKNPMRQITLLVVVLAATPLTNVLAQDSLPQPGARLRVTFPCAIDIPPAAAERHGDCQSDGTLALLQGGMITLATAGTNASYRLTDLTRVEISRGKRGHSLVGAGAGLLVGAAATFYLIYYPQGSTTATEICNPSKNQDAASTSACLGFMVLGGAVGAGLGAVIGALIRTERWADVPLEKLRVSLRPPVRGTLGVRVSLRF